MSIVRRVLVALVVAVLVVPGAAEARHRRRERRARMAPDPVERLQYFQNSQKGLTGSIPYGSRYHGGYIPEDDARPQTYTDPRVFYQHNPFRNQYGIGHPGLIGY